MSAQKCIFNHLRWLLFTCTTIALTHCVLAQTAHPKFHVVAIAERGGIHQPYVDAAKIWLAQEAIKDNFAIDYIENTDPINDAFLAKYQLFIQLNYPPYAWTPTAVHRFPKIY